MPKACLEKIGAEVHKKLYEEKHKKIELEDPELTLKPKLND